MFFYELKLGDVFCFGDEIIEERSMVIEHSRFVQSKSHVNFVHLTGSLKGIVSIADPDIVVTKI